MPIVPRPSPAIAAAALAAAILAAPFPLAAGPDAVPMPDPGHATPDPAAASEVVALINSARARDRLPPLRRSPSLDSVARARVSATLRARAFGHVLPGETFADRFIGAAPAGWLAAEVMDISQSPEDAVRLFLASPSHRRAILSPVMSDIGAAAARCSWGLLVIADLAGPGMRAPSPISAHAPPP